jgi:hypothetical protein
MVGYLSTCIQVKIQQTRNLVFNRKKSENKQLKN